MQLRTGSKTSFHLSCNCIFDSCSLTTTTAGALAVLVYDIFGSGLEESNAEYRPCVYRPRGGWLMHTCMQALIIIE